MKDENNVEGPEGHRCVLLSKLWSENCYKRHQEDCRRWRIHNIQLAVRAWHQFIHPRWRIEKTQPTLEKGVRQMREVAGVCRPISI